MSTHNTIQDDAHESKLARDRIEIIKQYISDNPSSVLDAASVAGRFQISTSSLLHMFEMKSKQTFAKYVNEVRINKAFHLIIEEGYRVQQAMYATGYKHKSTFNKAFKRKFKYPPTSFIK